MHRQAHDPFRQSIGNRRVASLGDRSIGGLPVERDRIVHRRGDPGRLQQVVWNLLSNAVKFTPKGGRIDVRIVEADSSVDVIVADTGIGFPSTFKPHMFERFRQAEGGTTRLHGGLGLGLAIARHIVEMHGGTIEAESPGEGKGATFRVRLPVMPVVIKPFVKELQR